MPVSRFLIPLVSTVWIFSVMGGWECMYWQSNPQKYRR